MRVCLIGQIFIDFLEASETEPKMRLGGIMHAARALSAMGTPYEIAYVAPDYLVQDIEEFAVRYGASCARQIGTILRCPNVVIVGEAKEIGSQRYEYLLRDQSQCELDISGFKEMLASGAFTDCLIFPGGFDLSMVLNALESIEANVFADVNFVNGDHYQELSGLGRRFASLILSTSSDLFLRTFAGDLGRTTEGFGPYADSILLKENRGGSRLIDSRTRELTAAPAQIRTVLHSVGVGDFFDAVFVVQRETHNAKTALAYASFAAAEYACSFEDSVIKESVGAVLRIAASDIEGIGGVALPWEARRGINVYLAGPDFDYIDTAPLNAVAKALKYHNFSCRRPVREHGQSRPESSKSEKRRLADSDVALLAECQLLVAVLLYDDPGTLIEVGIAVEKGIPVIVFDPFNRAKNLMLTELPILVSFELDRIVAEVFIQAAKTINERS